jgi:hypothetical protein
MVAAQNAAAAFAPSSRAEPVAPVIDDHGAARKAKAIARVRQLESQVIEGERARNVGSGWRALAEGDEPFANNVVKRSRPGRYWGSG